MKLNKKLHSNQRKILEKKVMFWLDLRTQVAPTFGWLKAIREGLGMTTRQLASRLQLTQSAVIRFERSEADGKISLESLQKVAHAMNCKLVYAIVPLDRFQNLDEIVDKQSILAARKVVSKASSMMKLEAQGLTDALLEVEVEDLAKELKEKMDSSIWDTSENDFRKGSHHGRT